MTTTDQRSRPDHKQLFRDQTDRLSALGHQLDDAQWDAPSLCSEWRVRDLYGHFTMGATYSTAKVVRIVVIRYRGNLHRASCQESIAVASAVDRTELLRRYDAVRLAPKGLAGLLPAKALLVDQVIHELDVRHALGLHDAPFPPDLMAEVLTLATTVSTALLPISKWNKGLSLRATDLDWSRPVDGAPAVSGPAVSGPAELLLLALGGREVGLAACRGDGVDVLRRRSAG
jgi:uncharacterized protein (TIGR03083 family)